jgi:ubiquinol-cytochrome c reductase cytochrome b subunit
MVVVLILHLTQTFVYGSYKGRRELLWSSGCVLAALVIAMAFSGYLLPWDQKAYFATAVGTNIAGEVPLIGGMAKLFMRGGADMGTLTLSRFFVFHVFLIPGFVFVFVAAHVYLFRKAGAAGPVEEDPVRPELPTERFYPRQVLMDLAFGLILIGALGAVAYFVPIELGPKANPADTLYVPRPEWYYLPIFQWLKYWTGPYVIVGVVVIPSIIALLVVGLPFIDRRPERRPWKRPVAVTFFGALLLSLFVLGGLSYRDDTLDVGIAMQLAKQQAETEEFMQAPFEPEESAPSLAVARVAAEDPLAAQGRDVYEVEFCSGCHGDGGVGTPVGSALLGIGTRLSGENLDSLLRTPTPVMEDGGMFALEIPDEEMDALVAYLVSLE